MQQKMKFEVLPVVDMFSLPENFEEAIQVQWGMGGDHTTQRLFRDWGTEKFEHSYDKETRDAVAYIFAHLPDEYKHCIVMM